MPKPHPTAEAPSAITTRRDELPVQKIVLRDEHLVGDRELAGLIDRYRLIDSLSGLQKADKERIKNILLAAKCKYGDGSVAYACIADSAAPVMVDAEKVHAAVRRRSIPLKKLLECGAIEFKLEGLRDLFSGDELAKLTRAGTPRRPAVTIRSLDGPDITVIEALRRLMTEAEATPGLFLEAKTE